MTPTSPNSENMLIIGVTWSQHRRTTELCHFLGIQLYEIIYFRRGINRYIYSVWKTWRLLVAMRPKVVFIQSPSLVLALYINFVKRFLSFKVVMDAHNESVQPYMSNSKILLHLTDLALATSDLVIVTNPFLAEFAKKKSASIYILPDRLPRFTITLKNSDQSRYVVAVICTSAPDEPIPAVLTAALMLRDSIEFQISGEKELFLETFGDDLPANVSLTGFLSADEYWNWLAQSDVVLDLTKMPDCLVCGAYEAVAVGTPMILSDNMATRDLFGSCALITRNRAKDIAAAILRAKDDNQMLVKKTKAFAIEYEQQWVKKANHLREIICQIGAEC